MKNSYKKLGGISSILEATIYLVGIIFYIFILNYSEVSDPIEKVNLILLNRENLYLSNFIIYILFGIVLVLLVLSLYNILKFKNKMMSQIAAAIGLIWAGFVMASGMINNIGIDTITKIYDTDPYQAANVWLSVSSVTEALGGGNEILGGTFTLMISCIALSSNMFGKYINVLGVLVGSVGIISAVPSISEISVAVFGFGQIFWFLFLGIYLVRNNQQ